MPTFDHAVTAADILKDALLLIGGIGEGESVSGADTTTGMRALNNMVKGWQNQGFHLWVRDEVTIFGVTGQPSYKLGPSSSDAHWSDSEDFVWTRLNGAASAAATTITVDDTTDMTADDQIGIELTDKTRQWTTIDQVASSTSLVINTGLTGAASDDGTVFTYTERPQRPLRVLHARRGVFNGSDIPAYVEPLEEYFDQPNKTTSGTVVFVSYKPTLISGTLYVWQPAGNVQQVVKLTVESPIADFDATSDEPNFPIEWAETLTFNLAMRLESQYRQLDPQRRQELMLKAAGMLEDSLLFDSDVGSWYLQPNESYKR